MELKCICNYLDDYVSINGKPAYDCDRDYLLDVAKKLLVNYDIQSLIDMLEHAICMKGKLKMYYDKLDDDTINEYTLNLNDGSKNKRNK